MNTCCSRVSGRPLVITHHHILLTQVTDFLNSHELGVEYEELLQRVSRSDLFRIDGRAFQGVAGILLRARNQIGEFHSITNPRYSGSTMAELLPQTHHLFVNGPRSVCA